MDECCPHGNRQGRLMQQQPPQPLVDDDDEAATRREIKALTAASALWMAVFIFGAFSFLYVVVWVVKMVFGWFGIY